MNSNEKTFNPQCNALEVQRFKKRHDEIVLRLQNQILYLTDRLQPKDFINEYLIEKSVNPLSVNPVTALIIAFNRTCDIESLSILYPDECMEILKTSEEYLNLLTMQSLKFNSQTVLNELVNVPIYNN